MIVLQILLAVLLVFIAFVFFVLFTKSAVEISYKNEELAVKIKNGFIRYKIRIPQKKGVSVSAPEEIKENVEHHKRKLTDMRGFLWTLFKNMRYKIQILKTEIKIDYGTGDPADTGVLYGVMWAAIGNIYQVFNQYFIFDFPIAEINPDFENILFKIEFYGIIKVRLSNVLIALIKSKKANLR